MEGILSQHIQDQAGPLRFADLPRCPTQDRAPVADTDTLIGHTVSLRTERALRAMLLDLIGTAPDEHDLKMVKKILAFVAALGWESERVQVEFYEEVVEFAPHASALPVPEVL